MNRLQSVKKNADSLVAAIAGFCIIILFTRHGGIGLSPDGVVYSSVAENIKNHGILRDYSQKTIVNFPVLYPVILSGISSITSIKPLFFAPVLNALLFAIIIYLSGMMLERFVFPSKWYKVLVLSCIVLSPCLLEVYSMFWSETFFIVWLLIFIILLGDYFKKHTIPALLATAVVAGLAAVTRYAGITVVATGGLLLLLDTQLPIRKKIWHLFLFAVTSPALLLINLARNYTVSGTLMGIREKAIRTLAENMHDTGAVFCDWLPFLAGHYSWAIVLTIILIVFFLILWLLQRTVHTQNVSYGHIACSFFLVYILFMLITASTSRYEQLNSRLLSPLFIPLVWGTSSGLIMLSQKIKASKRKWIAVLGILVFTSFQYNQLKADYETWDGVKDAGIPGYTEDEWKLSETVRYVQTNTDLFGKGYTVYSVADDAIYFFTGKSSYLLPHKDFPGEVNAFLDNPRCYVVWFNIGENTDLVGLHFIINVKKMKLFKQFSDGAIYVNTALR